MWEVIVGGVIALVGSVLGGAFATRATQKRASRERLHLEIVPNLRVANTYSLSHLEEARRHAVIAGRKYPPLVQAVADALEAQESKHPPLDDLAKRLETDLGRRWLSF